MKRFENFCSLIFVFVLIFSTSPSFAQQYFIKNYTIDEGLPGSLSLDVNQDELGIIWIASYSGLVRYYGTHFITFSTANGLSTNGIRNLRFDKDHNLWLGTDNGVTKFDGKKFHNFNNQNKLGKGTVWASATDKFDHLWFGTQDGGLSFFTGKEFKTYTTENGLLSNFVYSLFSDSKGNLWIGYRSSGLTKAAIDSMGNITGLEHFTSKNGLPEFSVRAIIEDEQGLLYAGTRGGGIAIFDQNRFHTFDSKNGLSNNDVYTLAISPDGELVAGTNGGGINFCSAVRHENTVSFQVTKTIDENNGILMNNVLKLFYDRENNLWSALSSGVSKIITTKFENFSKHDGLIDNLTYSVFSDINKTTWFGTTKGLSKLTFKNSRPIFTSYKASDGLPSEEIRSILRDSYGSLWVGTANGLCRMESNGKFKVLTTADGFAGNYVLDLYEDRSKNIWVSTNGGVSVFDPRNIKSVKTFTIASGLNSSIIYSAYQDKTGKVWIATSADGLNVYDGKSFKQITVADGLPNNSVRSILEDRYGNMWISTSGGGISRITFENTKPKFENFTSENGLNSNTVVTMIEDNDGFIWIGGNLGIDKIDPLFSEKSAGHPKLVIRHYDKKSGAVGNEVTTANACAVDQSGNIWFCFVEGITRYNPEKEELTQQSPSVVINRFSVSDSLNFVVSFYDNGTYKNVSAITDSVREFSHSQNNIRIEYSCLSFKDESENRYRYRLKGFEENWSEATIMNFKEYTNLPSGNYRFEVMAKNADGVWSELAAGVNFEIKSAFWNTIWFRLLSLLVITAGIVFIFKIRTERINNQNKLLEEIIQNRTKELSEYSQKLEVTNQELKEVNQLKTELLSIAAHDLKNPLTAILNYSELISNEPENEAQTIKRSQAIQRISDQMITTINGLLNMEAIENGQLKLHLEQKNILLIVESVIYNNLANAHSKNQTLDFSYKAQTNYTLKIDELKIKEVFDNLVSNAIKYSHQETTIKLNLINENGFIIFTVEDNGPGFLPEDKEKLFGRFQRLSARPTAGETSTGLGLSIAKQLVELHNGTINLESEFGKGSKFIVRLPVT